MRSLLRLARATADSEARPLHVYLTALSIIGVLVCIAYAVSGAWHFLLIGLPATTCYIIGMVLVARGRLARGADVGIVLSSEIMLCALFTAYALFPTAVDGGEMLISTAMYLIASTGFFARRHYQPIVVGVTGVVAVAVQFLILLDPGALSIRDVLVLATLVLTAVGSVYVFDLSHNLRRTKQDVQQVNADLTKAMEVKDRFLANMSHEIRTPLSGVIGNASLLLRESPRADQREYLEALAKSGRSLLSIVDDILNIAKIDAGGYEFKNEPMIVRELLTDVESLYGVSAEEKGLDLTMRIDEGVPDVICSDPERLKQIIGNLVSNAIKYTEVGSVAVGITLSQGVEPLLRLSVEDTGIGISPDDQPRLFQVFEQLDSSYAKRYHGTGLGLAITKRLVESAGGTIDLESEPGVGTSFLVSLPVTIPAQETEAAGMGEAAMVSPAAEIGRGTAGAQEVCRPNDVAGRPAREARILLAEDETINARIMTRLLESLGATVALAEDGAAVLARLEGFGPELIIMDAQMPGMSGVEATERIRSGDSRFRDIPIIGITAYSHESDVERLLAAGRNECHTKPVDRETLHDLLTRYLDEST